jgi:hypothetical protein
MKQVRRLPLLLTAVAYLALAGDNGLNVLVRRLVEDPKYMTGFDVHQIMRAGDSVTVIALKVIDPSKIRTEVIVSRMMSLIAIAFKDLEFIENPDDRIPGVTLFFLNDLSEREYSADLKRQISQTRDFLVGVRRKVVSSGNPH